MASGRHNEQGGVRAAPRRTGRLEGPNHPAVSQGPSVCWQDRWIIQLCMGVRQNHENTVHEHHGGPQSLGLAYRADPGRHRFAADVSQHDSVDGGLLARLVHASIIAQPFALAAVSLRGDSAGQAGRLVAVADRDGRPHARPLRLPLVCRA